MTRAQAEFVLLSVFIAFAELVAIAANSIVGFQVILK